LSAATRRRLSRRKRRLCSGRCVQRPVAGCLLSACHLPAKNSPHPAIMPSCLCCSDWCCSLLHPAPQQAAQPGSSYQQDAHPSCGAPVATIQPEVLGTYARTHVHTHTHKDTHTHTQTHTHTRTHAHTRAHTQTHTHTHMHACTHTHTHTHARTHVRTHTNMPLHAQHAPTRTPRA